jgi:hypothetical protein
LTKRCTSPISATKGHRKDEGDTAHRLVGGDHRRHRPARHDGDELFIETSQAGSGIFDRIDRILEDDLLRRVRELLPGQPTPVGLAPMCATAEDAAMTQQKR